MSLNTISDPGEVATALYHYQFLASSLKLFFPQPQLLIS